MDANISLGFYLFNGLLLLATFIGLYRLFEKAGESGWKALVPFLNAWVWCKIVGKGRGWFIATLIPIVNVIAFLVLATDLARAFGRDRFWEGVAAMLFPFIYFPWMGFSPKVSYVGKPAEVYEKQRHGAAREWADAIAFAVIAATAIRVFFFEAYTIPTTSMEGTLLAGDFLFVSKFHYGARVPSTPVAFPFAHHTMPLVGGKAYSDAIQIKYSRLPHLQRIKRNDIVVFNFPEGDTVWLPAQAPSFYDLQRKAGKNFYKNRGAVQELAKYTPLDPRYPAMGDESLQVRPVDKRENYIKRCVALPGDTLQIVDGRVNINGKPGFVPEEMQRAWLVQPAKESSVTMDLLTHYGFVQEGGLLFGTDEEADALRADDRVADVIRHPMALRSRGVDMFPNASNFDFALDRFGPVYIPKKGDVLRLTRENFPFYRRMIEVYEHNDLDSKDIRIMEQQLAQGKTTEYEVGMDYFFMMGDNRHGSQDSRYWGYVPEDHVVGKAWFVWWSWDVNKKFPSKLFSIRVNRLFKLIH